LVCLRENREIFERRGREGFAESAEKKISKKYKILEKEEEIFL
jgi:hypothetical protein